MEFIRWVVGVGIVMLTVTGVAFVIGGLAAGSLGLTAIGIVMAACGYGLIERRT